LPDGECDLCGGVVELEGAEVGVAAGEVNRGIRNSPAR
jgi:hypothetical protein